MRNRKDYYLTLKVSYYIFMYYYINDFINLNNGNFIYCELYHLVKDNSYYDWLHI